MSLIPRTWPVVFVSFPGRKGHAMVALVLVLTFVVLLLGVLVAGLLRSHADILKALHDLGAGVGDPSAPGLDDHGHATARTTQRVPCPCHSEWDHRCRANVMPSRRPPSPASRPAVMRWPCRSRVMTSSPWLRSSPRAARRAPDSGGPAEAARDRPPRRHPPAGGDQGPEFEIPDEVRAKAPERLAVIMSTEAWGDYEVPGSPFFVLVDGATARRIGEGVAHHFSQVAELVRRARVDVRPFALGSQSRVFADGLDGPARESANDEELLAAGIHPGHRSLYPRSLADVFPPDATTFDHAGEHEGQLPVDPVRKAG